MILTQHFFNILAFVLAILFANVLQGQDYTCNVQHYGVEEGLSHRHVSALFQDRDGFIWAATPQGLHRFDGYRFEYWDKTFLGISSCIIESIGQDDAGWLWIKNHTANGIWELLFFNPYTEEVKTLSQRFPDGIPVGLDRDQPGRWATTSRKDLRVKDHKGRLLFGSVVSPIHYTTYRSDEGFKTYPLPELEQFIVRYVDAKGYIWGSEMGNFSAN